MIANNSVTEEYLRGLEEIKPKLISEGFQLYSFEKKGAAYFTEYVRGNERVLFMFGPSDWDTEMIIFVKEKTFAFMDLLEIAEIKEWVKQNTYTQTSGRNVIKELYWDLELMNYSLPILERHVN